MQDSGAPVGPQRPLTWAEREFLSLIEQQSAAPADHSSVSNLGRLPQAFWEAIVSATDYHLIPLTRPQSHEIAAHWRACWREWEHRFRWYAGLGPIRDHPWSEFQHLVREGRVSGEITLDQYLDPQTGDVVPWLRLSALEHLLDITGPNPELTEALNERAEVLGVGLRLEGVRFVPAASAQVHDTVVRPALKLLSHARFQAAQAAYEQAHASVRSGEYPAAISFALDAIDKTLEALGCTGVGPAERAESAARTQGLPSAAVTLVKDVSRLRPVLQEGGGDAAGAGGPADLDDAMFVIHLCASAMLYVTGKIRHGDAPPDEQDE